MTFALTRFRAHGVRLEGPTQKRGIQRMVFQITAAATDVDLDLGDDAGTFWAAVDATQMGVDVKDLVFNRIIPQCAALLSIGSPELMDRRQVAGGAELVTALTSAASAGGSATETLTVTGLLTTDTILGAQIVEDGANPAYIQEAAKTCAVAAQYIVTFSTDPGAGAEVRVIIKRAAVPVAGDYSVAIQNKLPNIATAAADGETTWTICVEHELNDRVEPVFAEYGSDT